MATASPTIPMRSVRAALADRLRFDLTKDLGYRYPGAEDEESSRRLYELCWRA